MKSTFANSTEPTALLQNLVIQCYLSREAALTMAEKLIISISGMRGIVGDNLNPTIASEYGSAFGSFLKQNISEADNGRLRVCIGRDSRVSGQMLKSAVVSGLCATGMDVIDLGLVTTPCVGIMVKHLECVGGVIITASHNPVEYNGIKLLLGSGMAPSPEQAAVIKNLFVQKEFSFAGSAGCGSIIRNEQTHSEHIQKVLAIIDRELIAGRQFRVVLDSVNGAGGPVTKKLMAELGCRATCVNDEPSGLFEHNPEPIAENLQGLCRHVKSNNADVGFAQDPDADRLAIVNENGVYIGEEYTLALAASQVLRSHKGPVATNLSTSRMIDDVAAESGIEVIRTAVGEANVASAMLKNDCVIGGEGNGGVIDLRVGPVRDSLVAIALVLELMAETGKTISQLTRQIPAYHMIKQKFPAGPEQAKKIVDKARQHFDKARLNTTDGCRFDFPDGWLHLRNSNTEPVMRLIVEAKSAEAAKNYVNIVENFRKET